MVSRIGIRENQDMQGVVLVVDDNAEIRDLLRAELELQGYTVHALTNGAEAVDMVPRIQPDAILMDLSMPAMSGIETTRTLKSIKQTKHIPVIMITASDNKQDILESFEAGATDYVKKPVFIPELHSRLKTVLTSKKIHEELQKSENKYRLLVENVNEAIFVIQDEILRFFNTKASEILGVQDSDLTLQQMLEKIHPDDREKMREHQAKTLQGGGPPPALPLRIVSRDGITQWLEAKAVFIEWESNPATLNLLSDITERKRVEDEHRRFESLRRHSQKMEAVGTLADGIAHEFNNLLQVVKGYAQLLLLRRDREESDCQKLQEIVGAASRGGELTQQLLTFSRSLESERQRVDLNREVKQVKKLLDRTFPKTINIELHLADDLKPLNADPNQIQQTILNMAVNAKDAMPEGGVLVIETRPVNLDEDFCLNHPEAEPGDYTVLRIMDTGHGMDKETLERIFEPFYTTKGLARHSGLGLAVIEGIVKSHSGFIVSDSKPGAGTTFLVYLPTAEAVEELPRTEPVEVSAGGTETILLVDDEDSVRELGKEMLSKSGYSVCLAAEGESALKRYQTSEERIDLIILDLIMPGIAGEECLGELLKVNPQAKVIVASGHLPDEHTKNAIETKAKGFIRKPYDMTEMLKVVRKVLDEH
jgi:PAS domain S-box-containing protein